MLVLHQLGNHGPAYFRRHPESFRRFTPSCDQDELSKCSREQILNSYDNALLYTDHVLARTIDLLEELDKQYDTAMIYVSDHGESLGENGLYLHGLPYSIAPDEQIKVPMVMWFSSGFAARNRLDQECLRAQTAQAASHDNLFHTVLGLLDVDTSVRDGALDLAAACRH
ncbi:phosphoethanolamine transferase [Thauera sp.]|uniref:phosphoethanolamine transferase n=1 Tax=Thauera sp. TaxID=1905334 RepID=UPI0039E6C0EF